MTTTETCAAKENSRIFIAAQDPVPIPLDINEIQVVTGAPIIENVPD
jgi:hypothetical protein